MTHFDSLSEVQQRFEQWRQSRVRCNAPVPEALRQQALALCERHPVSRVTQALRINHAMIKEWRHDAAPVFMPLSMAAEPADVVQLSLQHPNGMQLQLSGLDQVQLSHLFSQFMGSIQEQL